VDTTEKGVDQVRDLLRGDPDTQIVVEVLRDVNGNEVVEKKTLKRQLVKMSDVRVATLLGDPENGIGYINLGGFNSGAAKDFRTALLLLRYSAPHDLKGLILDLRGNPGGLLDMAVEIATALVPEKSDIVSSRSKNGQEMVYRSSSAPLRPADMKLAVLVNKGSASAAEIVSGAVQDLDAGIIVGPSTTYGKGLVQKIIPLPYDSALKYTIARYYTPSGRCIQAIKYTGGREDVLLTSTAPSTPAATPKKSQPDNDKESIPLVPPSSQLQPLSPSQLLAASPPKAPRQPQSPSSSEEDGVGQAIPDSERHSYFTKYRHRLVRDGGGIEPDYKVDPIQMGPAETLLFSQGVYNDFAAQYQRQSQHCGDRDLIRQAAEKERQMRSADPAFAQGAFGTPSSQFFVVNPQQLGVQSSRGSEQVGITSKVSSEFFWGRPLQARFHDSLYRDFKSYVLSRLDPSPSPGRPQGEDNFISLDGALRSQLNELKQSLASVGLDRVASAVEALRPQIRAAVLENMDANQKVITDGVELALLSRELPSRLIAYHTIIQDEQVHAAFELVNGEKLPPARATMEALKESGVVVTGTGQKMQQKEAAEDGKLVSYDTLLSGQSP